MTDTDRNKDDTGWVRFGAAAKQLGVSPYVLRRWGAAGILPCYFSAGGQRRYRSADVAALVRQKAVPAAQAKATKPAAPIANNKAQPGLLNATLDPVEVAQAALILLDDLIKFDLGAVIAGDPSTASRLLYATPALAAELVIAGLGSQQEALLAAMLGPESQESIEVRKLDRRQVLLAKSAALSEMHSIAVVGLYAHGEHLGTLWLANRRGHAYRIHEKEIIARVAADLGRALANALRHERSKRSHLDVIKALGSALGAKDYYSLSHAARVAGYVVLLGRELGWPMALIDRAEEAVYLHDIGKIALPGRVLTGAMELNNGEWELVRQHPVFGAEIMAPLFDEDLVLGVRHHHEHYRGGGYPDGLIGEDIPMLARAMCVADSYDAMSYDRPHRGGRSYAHCLEELERGRGTQFDPPMLDAFLRVLHMLNEYRQVGRQAAAAAAARIDTEMHHRLALSRDPAGTDYEAISQILREERDAHLPTRYLSTVIVEGERCIYLVGCEKDPPASTPMGTEVAGSDSLLPSFGSSLREWNTLHADIYGLWITACHAPVVTPDGKVAALVVAAVPAPLLLRKLEGSNIFMEKAIAARRGMGRRAAAAAAERIDAEMHRRLALSRDPAGTDYAAISQILREERDARPPTRYLSTVIADGERCVYLVGSEEDPPPMGEEVAGGDALLRALGGEPLEWNALFADSYGLWVTSCYAPVVAPDCNIVALVVAAMPAPRELDDFDITATESSAAALPETTSSL